MRTGFKLEIRIDAVAADTTDNFFVATVLAFALTENLYTPALSFRVTRIHAEQVARENSGFIAARTCAHFEINIGIVVRVRRDKRFL